MRARSFCWSLKQNASSRLAPHVRPWQAGLILVPLVSKPTSSARNAQSTLSAILSHRGGALSNTFRLTMRKMSEPWKMDLLVCQRTGFELNVKAGSDGRLLFNLSKQTAVCLPSSFVLRMEMCCRKTINNFEVRCRCPKYPWAILLSTRTTIEVTFYNSEGLTVRFHRRRKNRDKWDNFWHKVGVKRYKINVMYDTWPRLFPPGRI